MSVKKEETLTYPYNQQNLAQVIDLYTAVSDYYSDFSDYYSDFSDY